jgi:hypothetical protein
MRVLYRGVLYKNIQSAAASTGASPVDLHLELMRGDRVGSTRFHTDEGDGYIEDVPIK